MKISAGQTVWIGRESGRSRLLVAVSKEGRTGIAAIGAAGSVPNSVSRCRPEEGTAHCKIEADEQGNMILTNLKSRNVTCVNGFEIISKRIVESDRLSLGKDGYTVSVHAIAEAAQMAGAPEGGRRQGAGPQAAVQSYSLKPLEAVWNRYHEKLYQLNLKQRNIGLLRSFSPILTIGSAAVTGLSRMGNVMTHEPAAKVVVATVAPILTCMGVIIMIYAFVKSYRFDYLKEKERITEEFQRNYACPNPKCHHFMGYNPYNILKQNKVCPYCRCRLTEEG